MKKELGDIVSKKVANAPLPTPPAMDWGRLDAVPTNPTATSTNGISIITKTILISSATIITLGSIFFYNYFQKEEVEQPVTIIEQQPQKPTQSIKKQLIVNKLDSVAQKIIEKKKVKVIRKNSPLTTEKLKKKDNFEAKIGDKNSQETPDAKRESKTTTIYEVDTVTTETYIYE